MSILLLSLILLIRTTASSASNPDIQTRIVGGTNVSLAIPFFVHALEGELCGGTLIAPDIVLTAAHCRPAFTKTVLAEEYNEPSSSTRHQVSTAPNNVEYGSVIIGSTDLYNSQQKETIQVKTLFPHPNYQAGTERNDIMLVQLASPSTTVTRFAQINTETSLPHLGRAVKVIGFGYLSEDSGFLSKTLQQVDLSIVEMSNCLTRYTDKYFDTQSHLCAYQQEKDACRGDSGGPLLDARNPLLQYGLVTFGVGCARNNTPGVYTKLSFYREWISAVVCRQSSAAPDAFYCRGGTVAPTNSPPSLRPTNSPPTTVQPTTLMPTTLPTAVPTTPAPVSAAPESAAPVTVAPTLVVNNITIHSAPGPTAIEATKPSFPPASSFPTWIRVGTGPNPGKAFVTSSAVSQTAAAWAVLVVTAVVVVW